MVVVFFGGCFSEYLISFVMVGGVLGVIDCDCYDVILVGIMCEGVFVFEEDDFVKFFFDVEYFFEVVDNGMCVLWLELGGDCMLCVVYFDGVIEGFGLIDVVLFILYGLYGEDGII